MLLKFFKFIGCLALIFLGLMSYAIFGVGGLIVIGLIIGAAVYSFTD